MEQYRLKITLQSDLCVSDGGVYNSLIDTDVCYDTYGFPYIPGKRLKGCLRECALELNDWGKSIPIQEIFGDEGKRVGNIRIGNARLKDYEKYKGELMALLPNAVACRQNIIGHFTYTRTQTRLDQETGVAETGSLRTFRVVKKAQIFEAQIQLDKKYEMDLKDCCAVLKHMGVGRTRGLGEVLVEMESSQMNKKEEPFIFTEADKLEYELYLEDPIVCKSVNGGEENTQDYIEGSKILGILLQRAKDDEEKQQLLSSSLIFSNAYISRNGKRCTEVPASYFSIKNNAYEYVDKTAKEAYRQESTEQLNQMKHCYVCRNDEEKLVKECVSMEQRYHHRRPEDKGIGRAYEDGNEDSKFYQISSISEGQSFCGYILGDLDELRLVSKLLGKEQDCYVGYGKKAEYGRCKIRLIPAEKLQKASGSRKKYLIVKLESPTIVYSSYATYTTDPEILIDEICAALEISKKQIEKTEKYINYTTVGGFNTTWGKRKPHIEAFDKGTVICLTLREEAEISDQGIYFVGERCKEGFGEMCILSRKEKCRGEIYHEKGNVEEKEISVENSVLGYAVCDELFDSYLRMKAGEHAKEDVDKNEWRKRMDVAPTVSNMLLMCRECQDVKAVEKAVRDRFGKDYVRKGEKLKIGNLILGACSEETYEKVLDSFNKSYHIRDYKNQLYHLRYLQSYLNQIKYLLRERRTVKHEEPN